MFSGMMNFDVDRGRESAAFMSETASAVDSAKLVPMCSRLVVLWRHFTRQSMMQMRRVVSDTCLITATISVVRVS